MILRAHHLLCLLGFRGEGYSDDFAFNMSQVLLELRDSPLSMIQIATSPDCICELCPHLIEGACQQRGPQSEETIRHRDLAAMAKLGLVTGDELPWAGVEDRIRTRLKIEDFQHICGDCQWLPLGYCAEGLKALKDKNP